LFMNSFNTHEDTLNTLSKYPTLMEGQEGLPIDFLQHRVPKILTQTFGPVDWPSNRSMEWCPPGHGDIYTALVTTGILRRLLEQGFTYAFVSNADNLGATLDLNALGFFASRNIPFMMEAADRTPADQKGGHVARSRAGGLLLRESVQCPVADTDAFQNIRKHRYFNSNNLWIHLPSLARQLSECENILDLPLIVNRKNVDPKNHASPEVFQLETAMGSALSLFPEAVALRIPRSRFAPVKTTSDLLVLWSDAYQLTEDMELVLHPQRQGKPPLVELDPAHYRRIDDFTALFPHGAPSLLHCDRLQVRGKICFDEKMVIQPEPLTAPSTTLASNTHKPLALAIVPSTTVAPSAARFWPTATILPSRISTSAPSWRPPAPSSTLALRISTGDAGAGR
ncbi:MAG: UTP--glucose-1-phosphate uridylyltransferase, partial [Anaerolineales bacterium]|nr:UTP--glucose-1-phosphate uridylyltransferase [Anaerolineales bacterium]